MFFPIALSNHASELVCMRPAPGFPGHELVLLAFLQHADLVLLQGGIKKEDLFSALLLDEPVTVSLVEPLDQV